MLKFAQIFSGKRLAAYFGVIFEYVDVGRIENLHKQVIDLGIFLLGFNAVEDAEGFFFDFIRLILTASP